VGGTRQRHFDETNLKPHKELENAQTPTTMAPMLFGDRVHAVLGGVQPYYLLRASCPRLFAPKRLAFTLPWCGDHTELLHQS
jgi:hypothetical protein